jgi:hypothetical protein
LTWSSSGFRAQESGPDGSPAGGRSGGAQALVACWVAREAGQSSQTGRIILRYSPPTMCSIIDETALHLRVGSPDIMATQMRQLTAVAAMPRRHRPGPPAIAHPATASGFVIADDAAYAEHAACSFVYTDQTVRSLLRLFDSLRAECYRAFESAALIERTCCKLTATPTPAGPSSTQSDLASILRPSRPLPFEQSLKCGK